MKKRSVAILGSTGSIGTQALSVISSHPDLFEVELLTANNNSSLLVEQAKKYNPNYVVITNHEKYQEVKYELAGSDIKVFAGIDSVCEILSFSEKIDIVLTAMVGFSGLRPTIAAIENKKTIALANKETLVAAGHIVMKKAAEYGANIIPVDSEHSAIFQCLRGEIADIEKIFLTASGGPFLHHTIEQMRTIGIKDALKHPRWKMGSKVTIDSASMMNKGLEMIEARWLFDISPEKIDILVHPQSIIHSMVQFTDGSITAQLSQPDMRIPIQYALAYPYRVGLDSVMRVDFSKLSSFNFYAPDTKKFPSIEIAYESVRRGGNIPCAMNAANEVAVEAFLQKQIPFLAIPLIVEKTIEQISFINEPDLEAVFGTDYEAKNIARELIKL